MIILLLSDLHKKEAEGGRFERRASTQTELEPEAEIIEPNIADEAEEFRAERSREEQEATEVASRVVTDSVVEAETLDGGRPIAMMQSESE